MIYRSLGLALVILGAGVAVAAPQDGVTWKSESVTIPSPGPFFEGKGADLLNQSCTTCHSADFVHSQPNLPLATWKVEVLKMKNVFHAPVADKDVDALAQILFERQPAPPK
jgi:hypothetical protein